jgi:3-oxocholest-4-en-26-oate---CoA ligase
MGEMNESLATLWEHVAAAIPGQVAVRHQARAWTFAEFEARSARLAGALAESGVGRGTRVACLQYNGAEFLQTLFATLKLSAVPVNVNYRYLEDELVHLLADSEAEAIVFHSSLADRVEAVLPRLPRVRTVVQVPDEPRPLVPGARDLDAFMAGTEPFPSSRRSGQDQMLVYTGGTTGLPKGVVWTHSALFQATAFSAYRAAGKEPPDTLERAVQLVIELRDEGKRTVSLPVVPLMHTTGLFVTIGTLLVGGTVVFSPARSLDPAAILSLVEEVGVTQLVIAGNAVARPLVEEIERADGAGRPYDLSSLVRITSSGVAWTDDVKRSFLERKPTQLVEILGATEGGPYAVAVASSVDDLPSRFLPAPGTAILRDDGTPVAPASDEIGVLAFRGPMPEGYHNDPDRTAITYRRIDGERYAIAGDYARYGVDGSIELLGRGSAVVNTGGEKVYTKEVEDALLSHPAVDDCVVVGVPDERWGEAVTAIVQLGGKAASVDEIVDHVGTRLAGYKKPRHVVVVDVLRRGPNGKIELRWARELAVRRLGGGD